jgi:hypothetical protein
MTVEEFLENFNCAPYDDVELAGVALDVEGIIADKANAFLLAREEFLKALKDIGYERG